MFSALRSIKHTPKMLKGSLRRAGSYLTGIFAHQGFRVYEALAHLGMITCILTARRPVYNESFHYSMTNQVERMNVSHYQQ